MEVIKLSKKRAYLYMALGIASGLVAMFSWATFRYIIAGDFALLTIAVLDMIYQRRDKK